MVVLLSSNVTAMDLRACAVLKQLRVTVCIGAHWTEQPKVGGKAHTGLSLRQLGLGGCVWWNVSCLSLS